VADLVGWLGTAVAVAVALAVPLGYFALGYQAIAGKLDTEAQVRAGMVSQLVASAPAQWRFRRHALENNLSRDPPIAPNQSNRLLDADGKLVLAMGEEPVFPVIVREAEVYDAGLPAGRLEIAYSARHLWVETLLAAIAGLAAGGAIFVLFRVLPLRALRRATAALEHEVEQHAQARREAESASRAKSQFLAAASHDLRQPMHALGLYAAVLEEKVSQPEVRDLVEKINASVEALEGLFGELLDISRLDAGVLQRNVKDFPVAGLLERLRAQFAAHAQSKGLELRVCPTRAWTASDPVLLERILINLVSNAIRYTSRGGLLIGCRRRAGMVRIEVWDTGAGIDATELPRVFDEFYQLGNPERDRSKGLGLGLAIVRRLGELLEHRIGASSTPGKGSCFSVEVPRCAGPEASVERPGKPPTAEKAIASRMLVVIDDESAVRDSTAVLLREWGYVVLAAGSLEEALQAISRSGRTPEVVLADYRLRDGATGLDAIRRLQNEFGTGLRAAVITGDIAAERLAEFRERGVRYLHKPVVPARLRELVSELLAQR
jgi:signal transduction histidine kinase/CheY-like chemotaxis protein